VDELLRALTGAGSPFELLIRPGEPPTFRHAPATLRDLYARVRKRPKEGVVLVVDDLRLTLARLLEAAGEIRANCEQWIGRIKHPGRIAIVLPDGPEFAAALIGVTDAGLASVLVPYGRDVSTLAGYIDSGKCDMVLTTAELFDALAGVISCPCSVVPWKAMAIDSDASTSDRPRPEAVGEMEISPDSGAIIAFTSGSSGRPKPVLVSHRALITGLWNMMLAGAWTAKRNRRLDDSPPPARSAGGQPCSLLAAPFTHVGGYSHLLLSLATGSKVVTTSGWNPIHVAELACREDAKSLAGATPRMILELLDAPKPGGTLLPIESFGVHGSALRRGLVDEIRRRVPGARFSTGYGLTETSGSIAATGGAELLSMPETCGPVLPTVEIEVLDEDGRVRTPGHAGEIRVRGAMLFDGYDPAALPGGGKRGGDWFLTGDIGVLDRDGYLTLLERGTATIRAGARGLYCADIERHIDSGQWGEEIVAVGTDEGQQLVIGILSRRPVDTAGLKLQLEQEFRIPGDRIAIFCRSELPRTSSGKIDRQALLALFQKAMADQA
jgi:long-chain acyl-CoA synthetase